MNCFIALFSEPWMQRLGWVLVHFIWQGAGIALLLAITLRFLSRASSQIRYAVIAFSLLVSAATPVVTWTSLGIGVKPAISLVPLAPGVVVPQSETSPSLVGGSPIETIQGSSHFAKASWHLDLDQITTETLPYIVGFWLAGVLILIGRLILGWIWTQRLCRAGSPIRELECLERFRSLLKRMQVTVPVRLLQSVQVEVPTLIGWLRPTILIPLSVLSGLSTDQLESILAHELAHVRRYDYLVNLLQTVIETILFYHPAIWWISRKLREERENCCDDIVLEVMQNRLVYASALALLEDARPASLALTASGGPLLQRINRIAGLRDPRSSLLPILITALIVGFIAMPLIGQIANVKTSLGVAEIRNPALTNAPVAVARSLPSDESIDAHLVDASLNGLPPIVEKSYEHSFSKPPPSSASSALTPYMIVQGNVRTGDGQPLPAENWRACLRESETNVFTPDQTDSHFIVRGVDPNSEVELIITALGYRTWTSGKVKADSLRRMSDIILEPAPKTSIKGILVNDIGKPIPGAGLRVVQINSDLEYPQDPSKRVVTNDQGHFEFEDAPIGGAFIIQVRFSDSGRLSYIQGSHKERPADYFRTWSPMGGTLDLGRIKALSPEEDLVPTEAPFPRIDQGSSPAPPFKNIQPTGKAGIGAVMHLSSQGQILVYSVFPGAPADQSGIRPGDTLLSVDNKPVDKTGESDSFAAVIDSIRGAPGTSVHITVERLGETNPLAFDVVRAPLKNTPTYSSELSETETETAIANLPKPDPQDSKAVRSYVLHISELINQEKGGSDFSPNSPTITTLASVGSANLGVLLEAQGHFESFYIEEAIKRMADDTNKGVIVSHLGDQPRLMEIVLAHDWVKDARQQLIDHLGEQSDPMDAFRWLEAALELRDPNTYNGMKKAFPFTANHYEMYLQLRSLPRFDMDGAVSLAWDNEKQVQKATPTPLITPAVEIATAAAEQGHIDALDYLVRVMETKEDISAAIESPQPEAIVRQLTGAKGSSEDVITWYRQHHADLQWNESTRHYELISGTPSSKTQIPPPASSPSSNASTTPVPGTGSMSTDTLPSAAAPATTLAGAITNNSPTPQFSSTSVDPSHQMEANGTAPIPGRVIDPSEFAKSQALLSGPKTTAPFQGYEIPHLRGQVFNPDGKPAAHAVLVSSESIVVWVDTSNSKVISPRSFEADGNGIFDFPLINQRCAAIYASSEAGYAIVSRDDCASIQLHPWGRIQGRAFIGSTPVANRTVSVFFVPDLEHPGLKIQFSARALTDAQGNFSINQVPSGIGEIGVRLQENQGLKAETVGIRTKDGQTTQVEIGGSGITVRGEVDLSEGVGGRIDLSAATGMLYLGKFDTSDLSGLTPQEQMAFLGHEHGFLLASDGTFTVPDVLPGDYLFVVRFRDNSKRMGFHRTIATSAGEFIVTPTAGAITLPKSPVIFLDAVKSAPEAKSALSATLVTAVRQGNYAEVETLLQKGVDPNLSENSGGQNALTAVAETNEIEIAMLLVSNAGDPDAKDSHGDVPIELALSKGNIAVARILHDAGGKISPVAWAAATGDLKELQTLLARNKPATAELEEGVKYALANRQMAIAQFLGPLLRAATDHHKQAN